MTTTRTIDVLLRLKPDDKSLTATEKALLAQAQALKKVEEQANRTREKMDKLAQVGAKLAVVGAAITAPFVLSMNKYVAAAQEAAKVNGGQLEPTARRLAELSAQWEQSQARLGKVTAQIVLPALEKGAVVLEKVISFAEKNPGLVQAALTIGTTLVVLGGLITTTAQLVSTVATIQGLAASAGLASVGGGAAVGAGGAAAAAGGGAAAAVTAGVTAAIPAIVSAFALWIGGNIGKFIGEALTGQATTWDEIALTAKRILVLDAEALDRILAWLGLSTDFSGALARAFGISDSILSNAYLTGANANVAATNNAASAQIAATAGLGQSIASGWNDFINRLGQFFRGGKAEGGYVGAGLYRMGERGSEFVLNAATTRAAENLIGARLNQSNALGLMTNNFQVGNGATIRQTKQLITANNAQIFKALAGAL